MSTSATSAAATEQLIGQHFDGEGFTGGSLSIFGVDCFGGVLPLESDNYWNNRVSSSRSGCTRLAHYDTELTSSEREDTVDPGGTLTALNNRVGMIAYHIDLGTGDRTERVGAPRFLDIMRLRNGPFERAGFTLDIDVVSGPSAGQPVACTPLFGLPSPYTNGCATSTTGTILYSYDAVAALGTDVLRFRVQYPGWQHTLTEYQAVEWLPSIDYDALGDSYSSGEGVGTDGKPVWLDDPQSGDRCHRSPEAYQYLLTLPGEENRLSTAFGAASNSLSFVACGGARTRNINVGGVGQFGEPAQLDDPSVGTPADLVTLTIGGNDAAFSKVLMYCATSKHECDDPTVPYEGAASFADWADQRTVVVGARVRETYQQVKDTTGDAPVFVLGYPQLFPDTNLEQNCTLLRLSHSRAPGLFGANKIGFTPSEQNLLRSLTSELNAELAVAAAEIGVHFVPVNGVGSEWNFDEHEVCSTGDDDWVWGPTVLRKEYRTFSFHPKAKGHVAYAGLLHDYMADLLEAGTSTNAQGIPLNPTPTSGGGQSAQRLATTATSSSTDVAYTDLTVTEPSSCGVAAPGGQVTISAEGFDPGSSVTVDVTSDTTSPATPSTITADANGQIAASVTVPTDNESDTLVLEASGPSGVSTLVAWGSVAVWADSPCPQPDDVLITVPGQSTSIDVSTNDIAPAGSTIQLVDDPDAGATFVLSGSAVTITGTDDVGTETAVYKVCDSYDFCVETSVTLTVDPGCTIWGTPRDDQLAGTVGDDVICGLGGDDVIEAGEGHDTVWAGPGDDAVFAGTGNDDVHLGPGVDTVELGPGIDTAPDAEAHDIVSDPPDDTDPPTATISNPGDGTVVARNAATLLTFSCADPGTGASGSATCDSHVTGPGVDTSVPTGTFLPTGTVGTYTVDVLAVDWAGNEATEMITYDVVPSASIVVGDPASQTTVDADLVQLVQANGFAASVVDDDSPTIGDIVVVAPSADHRKTDGLASVTVGLLALSADDLRGLGLTQRNGRTATTATVTAAGTHDLLTGVPSGTFAHVSTDWETVAIADRDLGSGVAVHATVNGDASVFTYDTGASQPGGQAPARRAVVGWENAPGSVLTADGITVLRNALLWLLDG